MNEKVDISSKMSLHFYILQTKLSGMQLKLGELEAGINDGVDNLENIQSDLEKFEGVNGDPKCLETYMKKLQVSTLSKEVHKKDEEIKTNVFINSFNRSFAGYEQ